jgi:hypothetical protein
MNFRIVSIEHESKHCTTAAFASVKVGFQISLLLEEHHAMSHARVVG